MGEVVQKGFQNRKVYHIFVKAFTVIVQTDKIIEKSSFSEPNLYLTWNIPLQTAILSSCFNKHNEILFNYVLFFCKCVVV